MRTSDRIARIVSETLGVELPSPHTDIVDSGLIDSLSLVTLLVAIEQDLLIVIPLDAVAIDDIRSVERLAALIDRLAVDDSPLPKAQAGQAP